MSMSEIQPVILKRHCHHQITQTNQKSYVSLELSHISVLHVRNAFLQKTILLGTNFNTLPPPSLMNVERATKSLAVPMIYKNILYVTGPVVFNDMNVKYVINCSQEHHT